MKQDYPGVRAGKATVVRKAIFAVLVEVLVCSVASRMDLGLEYD